MILRKIIHNDRVHKINCDILLHCFFKLQFKIFIFIVIVVVENILKFKKEA